MKIFIEGCRYPRKDVVGVLPESCMLFNDDLVTIDYVGYYRNPKCDDFVFFLPKVLVNAKGRIFCVPGDPKLSEGFDPTEIIDPEKTTSDGRALSEEQNNFLHEFAVWIYRSLALYHEKNLQTDAVWYERVETSGGFRRQYVTHTLLDVILALRRFHLENLDYFLFKVQELCYAFFDKAHKAVVENSREEYLLARKYHVVFEAMIDDLIGDGELESFKELRDDKEIDHRCRGSEAAYWR